LIKNISYELYILNNTAKKDTTNSLIQFSISTQQKRIDCLKIKLQMRKNAKRNSIVTNNKITFKSFRNKTENLIDSNCNLNQDVNFVVINQENKQLNNTIKNASPKLNKISKVEIESTLNIQPIEINNSDSDFMKLLDGESKCNQFISFGRIFVKEK